MARRASGSATFASKNCLNRMLKRAGGSHAFAGTDRSRDQSERSVFQNPAIVLNPEWLTSG
jgi:hypothetical protein